MHDLRYDLRYDKSYQKSCLKLTLTNWASAPAQFFFLELQIQISAGQFWQRNRSNIGICGQPLVRSVRRGCRTKWLDPTRRAMFYLPPTNCFCLSMTIPPLTGRRGDSPAFWPYFTPLLPVKRTRQTNYCYKRSLELWVLL